MDRESRSIASALIRFLERISLREIFRVAAERDLPLRRLNYRRDTLEDIFLKAMEV